MCVKPPLKTDSILFLVPKWQPLTLAKFPFYLNNMVDTSEIVATIVEIRNICETAQATTGNNTG